MQCLFAGCHIHKGPVIQFQLSSNMSHPGNKAEIFNNNIGVSELCNHRQKVRPPDLNFSEISTIFVLLLMSERLNIFTPDQF